MSTWKPTEGAGTVEPQFNDHSKKKNMEKNLDTTNVIANIFCQSLGSTVRRKVCTLTVT